MADRKATSASVASSSSLVDVPIRWRRANDGEAPREVFILCSRDSYKTKTRLLPLTDDDTLYVGVLRLPVGRYLTRMEVDGEWAVDDERSLESVGGDDYNQLIVEGLGAWSAQRAADVVKSFGTAPIPKESVPVVDTSINNDDDDDDDDDIIDVPATPSSASTATASSTDAPKVSSNASKKKKKKKGVTSLNSTPSAPGSPVPVRAPFLPPFAGLTSSGPSTPSPAPSGSGYSNFASSAPATRAPMMFSSAAETNAAFAAIREEVVKREQEWREAWILHELRNSHQREQEKGALRAQWKIERQRWVDKLKEYSEASKELRTKNLQLQSLADDSEAKYSLASSSWTRQKEQIEAENKFLSGEVSKARRRKDQLEEEMATLRSERASLIATYEADKARSDRQMNDAVEQRSDAQAALAAAKRRFSDVASLSSSASSTSGTSSAVSSSSSLSAVQAVSDEAERVITELRGQYQASISRVAILESQLSGMNTEVTELKQQIKDKEIAASTAAAAANAAAQEIQAKAGAMQGREAALAATNSSLEARIRDMTAADEKKSIEMRSLQRSNDDQRASVNRLTSERDALQSQSADYKSRLDTSVASLATLTNDITTLRNEYDTQSQRLKSTLSRCEEIDNNARAAKADSDRALRAAEADAEEKHTRNAAIQARVDTLLGDIDTANSRLKLEQAAALREKTELSRQINQLNEGRQGQRAKLLKLQSSYRSLSSTLSLLRQDNLEQSQSMSRELLSVRTQIMQSLASHNTALIETTKKYKKELAERRKYFNMVQELKGNIRVFCRVRPLNHLDQKRGTLTAAAQANSEDRTIKVDNKGKISEFEFDRVFGEKTTQEEVFADTIPLIQSCMDGYNVCIFAYGQTGSGKTFTMEGNAENRGVNFRALTELFRVKEERKGDYNYQISVSMMEVYNETIRDLLDKTDKECKIRKAAKGGTFVDGLTMQPVQNEEDVIKVYYRGAAERSSFATAMNDRSSRSHSILSVYVQGENRVAGMTTSGKLHMIDLAGSERLSKSLAVGDRMKEAQAINKSLSALGNVIEALQKKSNHVPYRNSKLTFLLEDSLGNHAKTLMFINCSPTTWDSEETICSLQFATRVRRVELGGAVRNSGHNGGAAERPPPMTLPDDDDIDNGGNGNGDDVIIDDNGVSGNEGDMDGVSTPSTGDATNDNDGGNGNGNGNGSGNGSDGNGAASILSPPVKRMTSISSGSGTPTSRSGTVAPLSRTPSLRSPAIPSRATSTTSTTRSGATPSTGVSRVASSSSASSTAARTPRSGVSSTSSSASSSTGMAGRTTSSVKKVIGTPGAAVPKPTPTTSMSVKKLPVAPAKR